MKTQLDRLMASSILPLAVAGLVAGCASTKSESSQKEQEVTLAEVSAPAQATVNKVTAGGQVDKVTKEVERGKTVYDVEATVGGKHVEYLIADADGELLGTETPIEFSALPDPVRAAAENYFGTGTGLTAMKGVEYGQTQYEIEGPKNGKKVEVTFDPNGKPVK